MPYRRTRSYRSSRRARPNYLWVRSEQLFGSISGDGLAYCDMLAPLHYDQAVFRIPGPGTGSPTIDLQNATVVKVIAKVTAQLTHATALGVNAGVAVGFRVGSYQQTGSSFTNPSAATTEPFDVNDPLQSANTSDWMGWDYIGAFDRQPPAVTAGAAYVESIVHKEMVLKSRRVLREPGDTLIMAFRPAPAAAGCVLNVIASTLVARRR